MCIDMYTTSYSCVFVCVGGIYMYVCGYICTCMHVCFFRNEIIWNREIYLHDETSMLHTHTHVHTYIHTCPFIQEIIWNREIPLHDETSTFLRMCTCDQIRTHFKICINALSYDMYVYIHAYIHRYAHKHACGHAGVGTHSNICINTLHMYTYIHTYIHTHACTCTQ